jgi:potassium efflux system protein
MRRLRSPKHSSRNWGFALQRLTLQKHKKYVWCAQFICFMQGICLWMGVSLANPIDANHQLLSYLEAEKESLTTAIQGMAAWSSHTQTMPDTTSDIDAQLHLIKTKLTVFEQFLLNQKMYQQNLAKQIKNKEQLPGVHLDPWVTQLYALSNLNNQVITLLKNNTVLAQQYESALQAQAKDRKVWVAAHNMRDARQSAKVEIEQLEQQRLILYEKNSELLREKNNIPFLMIDEQVLLNNQHSLLLENKITARLWLLKRAEANYRFLKQQDINALESLIALDEEAITQWKAMRASLEALLAELACDIRVTPPANALRNACRSLQQIAQATRKQWAQDQHALEQELLEKQGQLRKKLASRQHLMEYSTDVWKEVVHQVLQIPYQLYHYLASLVMDVCEHLVWLDGLSLTLWGGILGFFVLFAFGLYRLLARFTQEKARSRLSAHLYDGLLVLIYRNMLQITVGFVVIVTLLFNQVPFTHARLLIHLMMIGFVCRQLILIARLTLLERVSDVSGHDVTIYHRLKWLVWVGGSTTGLMVLSHEQPLSFILQDLFDRLFMLFLLAVSLVAWQSREVIPHVLPSLLSNKKSHMRHAVSVLGWLVPITLLTTALLGLVGYINLAWTMSRYQAYCLVVVVGYVLVRGLLRDALELLSEWMVTRLHNGWLWVEAVLKPLDKLIRLTLLVVSLCIILQWVGLLSDPKWLSLALNLGHLVLINWAGVHITLLSLGEFVALLMIFIWATKWTREFCYRWLYARVMDPGIRNSFAVFTQYGVVLLGCFVTLRVLGVDFTGMMVVLGGLAVGMGFGLRDFANNIVGGLMLLIERPVREGDLITIGDHEGRVSHIGIRSMRVSSWDNMEVWVPNAETFNKPFTNWTHQDSVVRTVLPIKVSRADDPERIQRLIHGVLAMIPEILNDPVPQVFLKQIDEALIEFEVRYFINVQLHTRFEIRSKALLAIMAKFKAEKIEPPIPPLMVDLKTHENLDVSRHTTDE